jgi:hypothetical protein
MGHHVIPQHLETPRPAGDRRRWLSHAPEAIPAMESVETDQNGQYGQAIENSLLERGYLEEDGASRHLSITN